MDTKDNKNQRFGWKSWVPPALASAAVFGLLSAVQSFNFWASIFVAVFIVGIGFWLLRRM